MTRHHGDKFNTQVKNEFKVCTDLMLGCEACYILTSSSLNTTILLLIQKRQEINSSPNDICGIAFECSSSVSQEKALHCQSDYQVGNYTQIELAKVSSFNSLGPPLLTGQ